MNGPIWIVCEGVGFRGHVIGNVPLCAMCGQRFFPVGDVPWTDITPPHERDDILARIRRGDFDAHG